MVEGGVRPGAALLGLSELPFVEFESVAGDVSSGGGSCAGARTSSGEATSSVDTSCGAVEGALNSWKNRTEGDAACLTGCGEFDVSESTFSSSYCAVARPAVTVMNASHGPRLPTVGVIEARPF